MGAKLLGQAIERLDTAGAAMRCADVVRLLENLGFTVRDGRLGGHKVVVHPHIANFTSASFNCDHGRNPEIKRPYIRNLLKLLRQYEVELTRYLEKNDV